ncbi:MAG: lipopolysaccharide biosynthesis protein [Flavobacteriales bacterium]
MKKQRSEIQLTDNAAENGDVFGSTILKKYASSAALQATSVLLTVCSSFLLARLLGAEGFGIYSYLFSWVTVLATLCTWGTDDLAMRECAGPGKGGSAFLSTAYAAWAFRRTAALSTSFVLALYAALFFFNEKLPDAWLLPAVFAIPAILFVPLLRLSSSMLLGLKKVVAGQWPEKAGKPALLLLLVSATYIIVKSLDAGTAVLINSFAFFTAMAVSVMLVLKYKNPGGQTPGNAGWGRSANYFLMLGLVSVVNSRADILMLGFFRSSEEVGSYALAARLSDFIPFALVVINPVTAPLFASYFKSGNRNALQSLFSRSAMISFVVACAVFGLLFLAGKPLLSFFGAAFVTAYIPMVLLGGGQLFNAFAGSVGNLLNMAGFEKNAFISQGIAVCCNILLNLLLIPHYGMTGAAIATAFALFLWNLLMIIQVKKKTGIWPTAFPIK